MTSEQEPNDWAVYQGIEDALRAYLRDADVALEAVLGVVDAASIQAFTCERVSTPDAGRRVAVAGGGGHRRAPADPVAR